MKLSGEPIGAPSSEDSWTKPRCDLPRTEDAKTSAQADESGLRLARIVAGCAIVLLLGLRWFYARSFLWDSDETQHLHVVWAWANGLLPYRDVFDNHTPLFHILSVPLFRALGERADIVLPMRLAMVPLYGLSLWCIYRIGAKVFSPRAGLWSAVLLGFFPKYFFVMGEYRTDVLWTVCWLGTLVVLTGGPLTARRLFCAGLIIGAAFSVSMKTTLLVLVMLGAGILAWTCSRFLAPRAAEARRETPHPFASISALVVGTLLIPSLIVSFFALHGALGPLFYCVITHNTLPGDQTPALLLAGLHSWTWITLLPAFGFAATVRPLFATEPARATRQLFIAFSAALFFPVLHVFWRMITRQDYVPWFPLLALVLVPGILLIERPTLRWAPGVTAGFLLLLTIGDLGWLLHHAPIFGPGSVNEVATIADALRLTERGEYVMDPKAGLVFRPRPYYYVLETLTMERLARGLLLDEIPHALVATHTAVVRYPVERLRYHTREFVQDNYLPVGHLAVLGKALPLAKGGVVPFEVAIPERYTFVSPQGPLAGTLDGVPLDGPRQLSAGPHELRLAAPATAPVMIWSRALERGFSPFDSHAPARTDPDT